MWYNNQIPLDYVKIDYYSLSDKYIRVKFYDDDRFDVFSYNSSITVSMSIWCSNNCAGKWGTFNFGNPREGRTFFFENTDDSVLFKLVWC
ncbi:MAG: hypothetical protein HC836_39960 [Richelia sp. RM2_1_2]|nr:hypothetical protein [Richelia sp. RM2_1_2]